MAVRQIVTELVERFERNKSVYCGSGYNETRLRREFLDPFFEALGWDVDNKRGVSPLYQDVVHEYPTEVDHSQKAADYAFRVGEKVKFFVEAKKPGTRLKEDAGPALQLRRYAYSAGLPLSILTDFEEFAAYDGRVPPKKADAASRARVMYFTYDQYVDAWDEIAAVFSRDAVWSGAFDKFAEEKRGGKAEPPDKLFLKLLEGWRDHLARNVANRNREKDLDKFELSGAVQAILDRIIFLRVAEDRGIEDAGRLAALEQGDNVYGRLMELCLEADDVYNSGLFHFRDEKGRATSRDELTPTLHVDDATLRKIIRELYDSPYEFGVVPVEILGQVYEQFLGKTIWLDGRGVHIDYKPEVRKAKGVYYTPQYIVEYIVKNTVGELLKGCKTPKDAGKLKILDPACGSGSFLLGAYQHVINWHLEWYVADGPEKHEGKVVATPGPGPASWRLTAAAKKDILVNNLFGVDIDPQAVEVTKLSLLLKALEGESRESVGAQTKFLHERILPDLGDNIKCGNSLIGSDYFEGQLMASEDERRRVNPFDWEVEFEEIMGNGGFDAVIGNPPYDVMEKERLGASWPHAALKAYTKIRDYYDSALGGKLNLFRFFIIRGLWLIRYGGRFGMIVPLALLADKSCARTRRYLMGNTEDLLSNCFPQKDDRNRRVFIEAKLSTCIITCTKVKRNTNPEIHIKVYPGNDFNEGYFESIVELSSIKLIDPDNTPVPLVDAQDWEICKKIYSEDAVQRIAQVTSLVVNRGEINQTIYRKFITKDRRKNRLLKGVEVGRYQIREKLSQGEREWFDERLFLSCKPPKEIVAKQRIATQRITGVDEKLRIVATLVEPRTYFADSTNSITLNEKAPYQLEYILGLLNSPLFQWRFKLTSTNNNVGTNELEAMPFREVNFDDLADVAQYDEMVALVKKMLELHKRFAAARSNADKTRLDRAITNTDDKINKLVYVLYGLTAEEIKIIEST